MDTHMQTIGVEIRGGRASSAPTIDNVEPFTNRIVEKKVRFHGKIEIKHIASVGLGRPVRNAKRTRWAAQTTEIATTDVREVGRVHEAEGELRR